MNATMNKKKRNFILALTFLMMTILVSTFAPAMNTYAATKTGTVTASSLNLRKKASTSSSVIKKLKKGASVTIHSTTGNWYKVTASGKTGYVYKSYVTTTKPSSTSSSSSSKVTGSAVVAYAKKFVGNPYKYGGTSLTKGTDCSGFTQSVYKHFGISIPRTSSSQRSCGKKVASLSSAKAGDIICYSGHVAIYMGNNKIIHASNKKDGIKISNNAKYKKILAIRRLV